MNGTNEAKWVFKHSSETVREAAISPRRKSYRPGGRFPSALELEYARRSIGTITLSSQTSHVRARSAYVCHVVKKEHMTIWFPILSTTAHTLAFAIIIS